MRDLSGRHATSPFAPDGTCRARHSSNHPHQSILRRGCSRIHRISISGVVVIATPHGGSACSPHGNIYAASTTRSGCPPFGRTSSTYRCKCPVYTGCERQGPAFKHRIDIRVAWHKSRGRGRTSARCRLVSGRHLVVGNDNVSVDMPFGFSRKRHKIDRWRVRYILLNPFLRVLTKSPSSALQSTLHALFLPTPFKYLSFAPDDPQKRAPEEVLKPGALYAECAVVPIRMPLATLAPSAEEKTGEGGGEEKTAGTTGPDDGEFGGIALGMEVWDDYERELKVWEAAEAEEADASR